MAVTTEEYAKQLLKEKPLTSGGEYIPQTHDYLLDTAAQIWTAVKGLLRPFEGMPTPKCWPLLWPAQVSVCTGQRSGPPLPPL